MHCLQDMEQLSQFDEDVRPHSSGQLSALDVTGKYSCRSCLYIITEGKCGKVPNVLRAEIPSAVDRWLVRFIKSVWPQMSKLKGQQYPVHHAQRIYILCRETASSKLQGHYSTDWKRRPPASVCRCSKNKGSLKFHS